MRGLVWAMQTPGTDNMEAVAVYRDLVLSKVPGMEWAAFREKDELAAHEHALRSVQRAESLGMVLSIDPVKFSVGLIETESWRSFRAAIEVIGAAADAALWGAQWTTPGAKLRTRVL